MHSSTQSSTPALWEASSSQELYDIVTNLLRAAERDRTTLSRTLHDELGGLLVSAVMDIGWAEQHLESVDELRQRLSRVRQSLAAAIDLKRNLIEELRPSLLENFGLFAACRWYVKQGVGRTGIPCTESYPLDEPALNAEASTGLFRILQETLSLIYAEEDLTAVHVDMAVQGNDFLVDIAHEHAAREVTDLYRRSSIDMCLVTHRVGLLGGQLTVQRQTTGTAASMRFPLERILALA